MRRVFKDQALEQQMNDLGYVVMDLFSSEEIAQCIQLFESIDPKLDKGFYTSLESSNFEYRREANRKLKEIVRDKMLSPLDDYAEIGFTFNVKLPKADSETPMHLDDCHVDEDKYISLNVWLPLVDTTDENGTLHVVPKSHKIPHPIRALGLGFPYENFTSALEEASISVPMKKGQILYFDSRIIHWAPPNLTAQVRPAMVSGLIPREAEPIVFMHYKGLAENQVEKFHAPFEFFSDVQIDHRPEGFKSYGIFEYIEPDFTEEELLRYLE